MLEIFVVLLPENVNITDNNLAIPAIVEKLYLVVRTSAKDGTYENMLYVQSTVCIGSY